MNQEQVGEIIISVKGGDLERASEIIEDKFEGKEILPNTYFVTNHSRVISIFAGIPRVIGSVDLDQYHNIQVVCTVNVEGESKKAVQQMKAAALINEVFNGPPPGNRGDYQTNHRDFRRRNNNPSNLDYSPMRINCGLHCGLWELFYSDLPVSC